MKCCPECFGDRGLSKEIIPGLLPEKGKCSFCGSENVQIVSPSQLAEYFELLIGAYKKDPDGKLLVQLFREDWRLFEHKKMDDPHAKELLAEILDDGEIVRETFARAGNFETDPLSEWEELRDELMYKNRFFPKGKIKERVTHLLPSLTLDSSDVPSSWFRARIQLWEKPFDAVDMGAPPRRTASHGRANPVGIPYLYLASTAPTAIAEVRPHAGELACVASFETPSDLKFVDLRSPRRTVSPFLLLDAEAIQKLRNDLPFLERLGDELTRPVVHSRLQSTTSRANTSAKS